MDISKFLAKIISKIVNLCIEISKKIYQKSQEKRVVQWFEIKGDETLRLDYNLDKNSIVFDIGGYKGQWSSEIFSKYCCVMHIFEPVKEFADKIEKRFAKNNKIFIYKFGLSNRTERTKISVMENSSSIFKKGKKQTEIQLIEMADFLRKKNIKQVDLVKINIEGSEYDLLEHLIETGFIKNIKNIQVQFHDFVEDAEKRMLKIQKKLQKTHYLTYQYPFVWENWEIKQKINKK